MDFINALGQGGFVAALCFAAMGSAFGTAIAGMGALGAWKRCYLNNKTAPFILIAFVGAPLSQTIYGMILMNDLKTASGAPLAIFLAGTLGGIAIGLSAYLQGKAAALAANALTETNKGLGNYIMVLGIIETVALFVMVLLMTVFK